MDGERQYPAPRESWNQEDRWPSGRHDPGYATGERRYADDPRWGDQGYSRYDDTRYPEPPAEDSRAAGGSRRREDRAPAGERPRRAGRRSGVELPDESAGAEGGHGYHTEALDRSALRRPEQGGYATDPAGVPGAPVSLLSAAGAPAPSGPAPLPGLLAPTETTDPIEAGAGYPPGHLPTQALPTGATVYRPRRAGVAAMLALGAVAAELLVTIKVLFDAVGAHPTNTGGVLGGLFAMAGIPMVAMGLYGLATGAATASGPNVGRAWLRTPLAYLPVGLILIMAAGMAA